MECGVGGVFVLQVDKRSLKGRKELDQSLDGVEVPVLAGIDQKRVVE